MFTSIDKALVALMMGVVFILQNYFGITLGLTETMAQSIAGAIGALLVWAVPNKTP